MTRTRLIPYDILPRKRRCKQIPATTIIICRGQSVMLASLICNRQYRSYAANAPYLTCNWPPSSHPGGIIGGMAYNVMRSRVFRFAQVAEPLAELLFWY